jgi:predicted CoA-substrate-specific enzyme activase
MNTKNICKIGVDVGSTTIKIVILNYLNEIIYKIYRRHKTNFNQILGDELEKIVREFPDVDFHMCITGSVGMGIAERTGIPFVQEVVSSIEVIKKAYPNTHTMIDLGGEDAKMVFLGANGQPDIRMNGSCAGGTGAFIDQMADLMNITVEEMGKQALCYEKIYPVASRCGVFAKTDVQNLISRNVPVPDISMSIFHTVALQSITTLARGCDIEPDFLCIGGPLTFIPALRNSFKDLLKVGDTRFILPENSVYFPAWGAALMNEEGASFVDLSQMADKLRVNEASHKDFLLSLFKDEADYNEWKKNRKIKQLKKITPGYRKHINCFLGIDSGSTTSKIIVIDEDGSIVYTFYAPNEGNSLKKVIEGLDKFYKEIAGKGVTFNILSSAATGYGEELIKSALNLDYGIVETMAHLSGAQYVDPAVSFVLDIGGQDIKSIFTNKGAISNIELNEACSSGCGSFLQNFAATMNLSLDEFTQVACLAQYPSDLGSRCTVFMNSKVKQSLRENASIGDIAAGLAYSVVKNCLFKVLKISNINRLGDNIVVQGGTFRNDAVFRALELLSGKSVSSTDYPELMGALGAALYSQKMWKSVNSKSGYELSKPESGKFTGHEALPDVERIDAKELMCHGCTNKCSVLRFRFDNGNTCYAGNKCEKVFYNKSSAKVKGYNAFDMKNKLLFEKKSGETANALRIGIPRVLNMFENYPFWQALFSECGLNVELSSESTYGLYREGVGSVMSDNICFPAKLVHGHIHDLADKKVDRIFYPIVPKEMKEFGSSNNSFNCPVVSGYPDVIRSAMNPEEKYGIPFDKPVITLNNDKVMEKGCFAYLSQFGVTKKRFDRAFRLALEEREKIKKELIERQKSILDRAIENNEFIFVVAGRPYHTDPLIHQKVGQILSDLGVHAITDDVFRVTESRGFGKLSIVSQWSYPNRVVQAAMEVARLPGNVQLIQLNSFGCGPDSFFMDETTGILKEAGKNHTVVRIDEIAGPGSVRLRLRSLIESLKVIPPDANTGKTGEYTGYKTVYTKDDRRKTILVPWFADFISPVIPALAELAGYKIVNMPASTKTSAETGLKYGNNEVCYPSTLILGDIITTLQSGKYNLNDVVVAITQTGGQCRATNYLAQIKYGLKNAGFGHIPVLVFATGGVHQNEQKAFKVPVLKLMNICMYAVLFGDAIQQMHSSTIIREINKGQTQELFDFYMDRAVEAVRRNSHKTLLDLLGQAVEDFNDIKIHDREFTKVGLIGEIFVKYNNYAQAHITEWLRSRNMEVVTPPLIDFVMQYFVNSEVNTQNGLQERSAMKKLLDPVFREYMNTRISAVEERMKKFRFHEACESIYAKAEYASEILDLSNQFGEGWTIAGEAANFVRHGINKVVCIQPFGCIANHIVAKGIEKRLKKIYPGLSILYLDIDGGMAEVNLQNRLHFLIN